MAMNKCRPPTPSKMPDVKQMRSDANSQDETQRHHPIPPQECSAMWPKGHSQTRRRVMGLLALLALAWVIPCTAAWAQGNIDTAAVAQSAKVAAEQFDPAAQQGSGAQSALRILIMMTVLSLLPSLLLTLTCFTRIIIVFSFLRQALGVQGMPPNQIMVGMALFLSAFIMAPTATRIYDDAVKPYTNDTISIQDAVVRAKTPIAEFMLEQTSAKDIELFLDLSRQPPPETREQTPFVSLAPAFILSELRTAFQMGFLVLLPFMVVDLIVASILMAMGMMMLPPALIALPLKVMIFVLADGWTLTISSLTRSFSP